MSQNKEIKALVDATIISVETSTQINCLYQEKFKQQQEDILNSIAEYLVEYLKPLLEVKHLLTNVNYDGFSFNVDLYVNNFIKNEKTNDFKQFASFSVDNNSEYIKILYFYDSNEIVIKASDDVNELFDVFLNEWENIKNKIDLSIESQLKKIQEYSLKKIKVNQARADLYNNFKV